MKSEFIIGGMLIASGVYAWLWARFRPEKVRMPYARMRLLCIVMIAGGLLSTGGHFMGLRKTHTREFEREFSVAVEQLKKSPAGIQRVDTFVQNLKKIDISDAPIEVKTAFQTYIATLQKSLQAYKAGGDLREFDPAIAEAKQRLMASVKKYD